MVIDPGLDRLHEVVAAKLDGHPVLGELDEEAATATGQVSELTRQQVELALTAAARRDELFGQAVSELLARLREAEQASGRRVSTDAQVDDGGVVDGEDVAAEKAPPVVFRRGFGVRGGGPVVSLP